MDFCTIASGSSGNSIFMGTEHTKILIDAGVSGKRILEGLEKLSLTGDQIDALFITHEHIDHVKGLPMFLKKAGAPVFASNEYFADGIFHHTVLRKKL